jgi:hypothetical protein
MSACVYSCKEMLVKCVFEMVGKPSVSICRTVQVGITVSEISSLRGCCNCEYISVS